MQEPKTVYETLQYRLDTAGVATIALDQPETRNALSEELLAELEAALLTARDDPAVRVVVLASTHATVFSSGGDLSEFGADTPVIERYLGTERFPRIFGLLGELGKPSICAASGHVLAGALGLALACDLIVAKDTARFGTPELAVGLFPFMVTALAYRNLPRKKATELLLLGEQISAHEAERFGFVNRVVSADEFGAAVDDWASKLAAKSPLMLKLGKDAIFRQQDMAFAEALEYLRAQLGLAFSTADLAEGIGAFLEKRDPVWKGR
jgi:enoyl-CoA hydratase